MIWVVMTFLGLSLLLYCILGGADFGAGALEFFVRKEDHERHEELVNKAMGPVWEANHIWLIILIVILFNGFPKAYTEFSIYFHIPLMLMLIGIVFRGCAFTFRHYDVVKDHTRRYYSLAFSLSSMLTPVMFGMIIGGVILGVDPEAPGYYPKFIAPWFNLFAFSLGIFVLSLFAYLASVFLIGESEDALMRDHYIRRAKGTNIILLIAGAAVFVLAEVSGHHLLRTFFTHPVSLGCFALATVATLIFWGDILKERFSAWRLRFIAGVQVGLVLLAWLFVIYPNILFYKDGNHLSLFKAAAPEATLNILGLALIIGSVIFLPVLYYLFKVFKIK